MSCRYVTKRKEESYFLLLCEGNSGIRQTIDNGTTEFHEI